MKTGQAADKRGVSPLSFLMRYKAGILYAFSMNLALLVPAAMSPAFKKTFSNDILDNAARDWLLPLILTMFGAAFISGIASYLQRQCSLRLSEHIESGDAANYVRNMLCAPSRGVDEFTHLSQIYAAKSVAGILAYDLLGICFAVVGIAIYLPLMFREDVFMTIAALTLAVASIALSFVRGMIAAKFSGGGIQSKITETAAKRMGLYGLMSVPAIKASASEGRFFSALISARSAYATAGIEKEKDRAYEPFDTIGQIFFMDLLLFVSAIRITQRSFTVGSYLAFQAYASMLFEPMKTLVAARSVFDDLKERLARLKTGGEEAAPDNAEDSGCEPSGYALRVDGVPFSFNVKTERKPDAPDTAPLPQAAKAIRFHAGEGARITVAGGTERERTAFLRILAGLEPPREGTVSIGGIAASTLHRRDGTRTVGYAARTPIFFSGTLRDNVTFWDKSVPDAAILAAFALVGFSVNGFADGLDYRIMEGGQNLSVGERRRVELARGLLHDPKIVIVDDILYRLDAESRTILEDKLKSRGVTLIASSDSFPAATDVDEVVSPVLQGEETDV